MTQFKITSDSIKRITSLASQSKEIASVTKPIFILENNKLNINLFSDKNFMKFDSDITDYVRDVDLDTSEDDFFSLVLSDFTSTLTKISNGEDVEVSVDRTTNKITFKNASSGSKISLTTHNSQITTDEVVEAKNMVQNAKQSKFVNTIDAVITPEVISFFETAQKFMNVTLSSNAICVNQSVAKYMDILIVLKKTLSTPISSSTEDIYLQKSLIDFIKPMVKTLPSGMPIKLNSEKNSVLIESTEFGFTAGLGFAEVQFEYPSDEELEEFAPNDSQSIKISIRKDELKNAFDLFNGTFKAENWKWSIINLMAWNKYLDTGKVHLEHSDYNAEVFTDVNVQVLNNTETSHETQFLFSSSCISDLLNLISEDEITMSFNSIDVESPHGAGFTLETPTITAVCCKVTEG